MVLGFIWIVAAGCFGQSNVETAETTYEDEESTEGSEVAIVKNKLSRLERAQVWEQKGADFLVENLEAEPRDVEWANEAEENLAQHFTVFFGGDRSAVKMTMCMTSFCRVKVGSADESIHELAMEAVGSGQPWTGDYFARFLPHDTTILELFISREGHRLPSPPDGMFD
ncbi:MAG: hypothetical protein ACNA8W_19680 [Bradymonadaceae bacterium]